MYRGKDVSLYRASFSISIDTFILIKKTKMKNLNEQPAQVEEQNEVNEFQSRRYVSGAESAHRLRGNELAERKPTVSRLPVHLEGQQTVFYDANDKDDSIEKIERSERTKLTAFFELNNEDEFARTLLYRELPEHYTWNSTKRKWKKRKREPADGIPEQVGRLFSIHPPFLPA